MPIDKPFIHHATKLLSFIVLQILAISFFCFRLFCKIVLIIILEYDQYLQTSTNMTLISRSSSFSLPPAFMLVISTVTTLIEVTTITVQTMSAFLAGQVLLPLSFRTMLNLLPVFTLAAGTLVLRQI